MRHRLLSEFARTLSISQRPSGHSRAILSLSSSRQSQKWLSQSSTLRQEPTAPPPVPTRPATPVAPRSVSSTPKQPARRSLATGLDDPLPEVDSSGREDWARSYHGLSDAAFSPEIGVTLMQEIDTDDIEIKPDGIIFLPEIKYRRILNKAFGPGGWGLAPRGETIVTPKLVTREYGLVCRGRLVSIARGEMAYFDPDGIPTATEGCKSNALMRCCKDLGIASELWDPRFIRKFLADKGQELFVEHATTKKRRKHWMRKDDVLRYPWKEVQNTGVQRYQ